MSKSNDNDKDETKAMDKQSVLQVATRIEEIESGNAKLNGDKSSVLSDAEKRGLHKKAFKDALSIKKMDEHTRSAYLEQFDIYCDYFAVREFEQGEFPLEDAANDHDKSEVA